jgi:Fe-S cluster biogenesis protein NfuA
MRHALRELAGRFLAGHFMTASCGRAFMTGTELVAPRALALAQAQRVEGAAGAGRRRMFVQTQNTPNPQSLMFLPGKVILPEGQMQFDSARDAMQSPLAKRIFAIDGVRGVFLSNEFLTVTVTDEQQWQELKPQVYAAITDFYTSGDPVLEDGATSSSDTAVSPDDDEVVAMIKELIETRVKPAVAEDGGDIVFKDFDFDSGVVSVKMQGSCSGCPSSAVTLKAGIENMLVRFR